MARGLPETLVGDSTIYLFGRVMKDIQLGLDEKDPEPDPEPDPYRIGRDGRPLRRLSPNHFVIDQLRSPDAKIARIYAFSFQNEFFELVRPALFVVNGYGHTPLRSDDDRQDDDMEDRRGDERTQRDYAFPLGLTGLAQMGGNLATELRVWAYDRDDYSVRLDVMTGSFDRILIEHEFAEEGLQGFVRGGGTLGTPSAVSSHARRRPRRWRSDDD
jgi:hypothetical protein